MARMWISETTKHIAECGRQGHPAGRVGPRIVTGVSVTGPPPPPGAGVVVVVSGGGFVLDDWGVAVVVDLDVLSVVEVDTIDLVVDLAVEDVPLGVEVLDVASLLVVVVTLTVVVVLVVFPGPPPPPLPG
ncbi:hypothetical protein ACHAQA_006820 [Verticillium albo-atrum]